VSPAVLPSTLLALFAAASLVFGSALPTLPALRTRFFADRLSLLIGFSAGLMLATALHELIPEALEKNPQQAMWGVGVGFLTLYIAERLTHFHACRHRECDIEDDADAQAVDELTQLAGGAASTHHLHLHSVHSHAAHSSDAHGHEAHEPHDHHAQEHRHGTHVHGAHSHGAHAHGAHSHGHADSMALAGMSVHNLADGLTTAAAFTVSKTVGIVVVVAIVLHQMAAGLSLGAIMMRMGRDRRRIWISTTVVASFILWGALLYHFVVPVGDNVTGIVLGIAAGSFLYVAACDLLPEAHAQDEGWSVMATTLGGYIFALLATVFFGSHEHGGH
jgi:zinc transporter ZupT